MRATPEPSSPRTAPRFPPPAEAAAVAVLALPLLLAFQLYVDNVFIITTNGLWKSVVVRQWADHPDLSNLDLANVLYFPVYGRLVRLLDGLSVFPGITWKQTAVLNAVFASAALGCIYGWTSRLFGSRRVGLLTAVFYLGSGHFLTLAVINEDIMPSYFFVLVAMLLAATWFGRPTILRILAVAVIVSVGWLFEWRLLFPVVPPMLLALWLSAGEWRPRIQRSLWFAAGLCFLPVLLTLMVAVRQQMEPAAALSFLGRLFWVGKGVGTGWAGFSAVKLDLTWAGMAESLVGGRYLQSEDWWNHPANLWEVFSGTLLLLVLAAAAAHYLWERRGHAEARALAAVFGGTFVAGEVFNFYSQPQDPQMQLNVMAWIIPAWGMLIAPWLTRHSPSDPGIRRHRYSRFLAIALSLFPLANTVPVIAAERGGNARYLDAVARLERELDPSRTFFLYLGFDALLPWQFVHWGGVWPDLDHLPPAPADIPKFKWLSITDGMIWHRDWTPDRQAEEVRRRIDRALDLGYRVVTNQLWNWSERTWVETTATIARPETPKAVRRALLQNYRAQEVYVDPVAGPFFELKPLNDPPIPPTTPGTLP